MSFWGSFWRVCIAAPLGGFWCAYGIIAPLICLRFGIPATNYLQGKAAVDCGAIRKKYWLSVLFWLVVDAVGVLLVVRYASYVWAYGIAAGAFITFVSGVGKTGINMANISDYVRTNAKWIEEDSRGEVAAQLSALSIIVNKGQIK